MKAALFDLDDTLYRERTYVESGFAAVARFLAPRLGRPEAAVAERLSTLHDRDGRGRIFQSLLADAGVADPDDTLAIACVAIYRANRPTLEPFPGVVPTLARLRAAGLALGLVSDGLASVQRTKLAALSDVAPLLDVIVLTGELGSEHEKPSPVPFRVATELLGTQPHLATYVGNDARKDFAGARLAGLRTIRVGVPPDLGGPAVDPREWSDADLVLDRFEGLPEALLGNRVEAGR